MADDLTFAASRTLIAGRFAVDTSQALLDVGGGLPAYPARDRMAGDALRVALSVSRDASPRMQHLRVLDEPIDHLMTPLGHGIAPLPGGNEGYFVVCTPAPGPVLSASLTRWPEKLLIDLVLRPIVGALNELDILHLTHRAIRLNNVFQSAPGQPVTLGAAWAAPPAMHQPVVFESPYSAMCHPAGRGEGSIADDVYALGVLLISLAAGRLPMANMDDDMIIRSKLEFGSFAALTRDNPVSGSFAELLRVMLAEDPDHRPLPSQLVDHANLRGRRVGVRPPHRSQRPLMLNDIAVFDTQTLAFALSRDEKKAIQFLRNGLVTQWLRRNLGDAIIAAQIEDLVRGRSVDSKLGARRDPLLLLEIVCAINPRMPLCWRGIALWPDALPAVLAAGISKKNDLTSLVDELLVEDIAGAWAAKEPRQQRPVPPDLTQLRTLLQGGGSDALLRLFYALNPLLPCRAPTMATRWIATMPDLMGVLERAAATTGDSMIDLHISTFVAARSDRIIELQVLRLVASKSAEAFRSAEFALLRDLQSRYHPAPMPGVAKWVAARLRPDLGKWRNKPKREALHVQLDALAQAGLLSKLLELAEDKVGRTLDMFGAQSAANEVATIDSEIAAIDNEDDLRLTDAKRFGQAVAGGIGLSAFILTLMSALMR